MARHLDICILEIQVIQTNTVTDTCDSSQVIWWSYGSCCSSQYMEQIDGNIRNMPSLEMVTYKRLRITQHTYTQYFGSMCMIISPMLSLHQFIKTNVIKFLFHAIYSELMLL